MYVYEGIAVQFTKQQQKMEPRVTYRWARGLHASTPAHIYQYVRTCCHKGVTPSTKLKNKSEYHTSAIRNTRPSYPLASAVL